MYSYAAVPARLPLVPVVPTVPVVRLDSDDCGLGGWAFGVKVVSCMVEFIDLRDIGDRGGFNRPCSSAPRKFREDVDCLIAEEVDLLTVSEFGDCCCSRNVRA